jgi:pre-rRNA-processing protein TSR1
MAIGNVSSVNPDRIMLKKVVLSGIPMRVGKNKALVKDMFYNPDDVRWFKPIDVCLIVFFLRVCLRMPSHVS